jgi:hypothetical protein
MPARRSAEEREAALALFDEYGAAETARRTGIPVRTVTEWASKAGLIAPADAEKTRAAHAATADRVQRTWADFRENEALSAGAAANVLRTRIRDLVASQAPGREVQAHAVAYGILIDKAELLSGQASQRIEVWAQTDLDVELRGLIVKMEDTIRERRPAT